MGCTLVQKLLKICSWLWCWKTNTLKEHKSQETSFYEFLFIWKLIKHIPIWNRYPKRLLMKPKVILLKPSWINQWNFVVVEILHTSPLEITITTYDTLRWIRTSLHSEVIFLCNWKHLSTHRRFDQQLEDPSLGDKQTFCHLNENTFCALHWKRLAPVGLSLSTWFWPLTLGEALRSRPCPNLSLLALPTKTRILCLDSL
jgi:hypothetical protein